jgi:transcriptional regulator
MLLKIMYKFPYYTEADEKKVIAFMKENPFAILTGTGSNYPVATQIPLEVEEKDGKIFLTGHLMKKTDHHLAFEKNNNVLVIFTGPHCYISASWYSNPQIASTWNYMTVHAKGKITFTDEAGTYNAIREVTNKFEGTETIGAFNNLSKEYIAQMIKAIVGFTIAVESVDNVFKLSQNRDEFSKLKIIEELKKRGDENSVKIAEEMKSRLV